VAPVALLQQCENGSTVAFVGVVEHRLHVREHHLAPKGGLNEEGGRLAKEGVASPHKHIDTLLQSEQTHITSVRIELEKEAKWSPRVVPRSCARGATLFLSKLCHCLNCPIDLVPFAAGLSVAVAVLVHLHREESHDPRVHRFANDVEQVGAALVRSVALTRTPSLVRAQHVTMVISAFVRPLHVVLVHHSRYQTIQNDILPPLVGRWWFASCNSGLCFQEYFASYTQAVSSVRNLALGGELVPALVAAPCRGLCEVGVAVIARTANPPTGTDAGTSTARLLARTALPQMLAEASASTARLLATTVLPPMVAVYCTSTARAAARVLAINLAFSMKTELMNPFRLLCYFNTFFHWVESELGRVLVYQAGRSV